MERYITCFIFFQTIYMDISGNGLRFDTLSDGQFPVMNSIIMLLIDCVLYAVLAFWLDNVVPSEYRCYTIARKQK